MSICYFRGLTLAVQTPLVNSSEEWRDVTLRPLPLFLRFTDLYTHSFPHSRPSCHRGVLLVETSLVRRSVKGGDKNVCHFPKLHIGLVLENQRVLSATVHEIVL